MSAAPILMAAQAGLQEADELASAKLARKAASARLARARHKNAVNGLEDQVRELQERAASLEAARVAAVAQAAQELHAELRAALPADRWETLSGWLNAAREEQRAAEALTSVAPPPMPIKKPPAPALGVSPNTVVEGMLLLCAAGSPDLPPHLTELPPSLETPLPPPAAPRQLE